MDIIEQNFKLTSLPPVGPSYILPDGRFIDIAGSIDHLIGHEATHYDFTRKMTKLLNNHSKACTIDQPWVRVNKISPVEPYGYVVVPKYKMTCDQQDALQKWLDNYFYNTTDDAIIQIAAYGHFNLYFATKEDYLNDDIIKNIIKKYYK